MFIPRVIPCLLLQYKGLVKTVQFKNPIYIGDPINAVQIFNKKQVNELIFLDIEASRSVKGEIKQINYDLLARISKECMMPLTYGGGIRSMNDVEKLFNLGVEKIALNTIAFSNPKFITECSERLGSQSVVVSIDAIKKEDGKYEVVTNCGQKLTGVEPSDYALEVASKGAGEILINSINLDGTFLGYDIDLIRHISEKVSIPVIACGGAGNLNDFVRAVNEGYASAVAAGSLFVFFGKKHAVLISYPDRSDLNKIFEGNLF